MITVPALSPPRLRDLDATLLEPDGRYVRLMPANELRAVAAAEELLAWCVHRARYQLPTLELVEWLRGRIRGRRAIEIGSGQGDMAHHLGILGTDSGHQSDNVLSLLVYASMNVPPTTPPRDVERIDAEEAVAKHRPEVVIGCWITQRWREGDPQGNVFGPEEATIVRAVASYIHVGNERIHGSKRIRELAHETHRPPWLVSRAYFQALNLIDVWGD